MSDPTNLFGVLAIAGGFLFLVGVVSYLEHRKQPHGRDGAHRNAPVRAGTRVPYHCATFGHYYAQESGHWVCQNDECRDTRPVAGDLDALDQMAFEQAHREDFRRWEASS